MITPVLQRTSPDVSGMTIRFLIIEPSPEYRSLLSHHLTTRWPDAAIMEYDPVQSGRLAPEFSGAGNDLVILGDPLGEDNGLDWLRRFRMVRTFPPVIILGAGNERSIVEAIKAGATDYISRDKLNHKTFIEICESAVESAPLADAEQSASSISARGFQIPDLKGYTIRKQISGGDIASVYLTEDAVSGRSVVLKVLCQIRGAGTGELYERHIVRHRHGALGAVHFFRPRAAGLYAEAGTRAGGLARRFAAGWGECALARQQFRLQGRVQARAFRGCVRARRRQSLMQ